MSRKTYPGTPPRERYMRLLRRLHQHMLRSGRPDVDRMLAEVGELSEVGCVYVYRLDRAHHALKLAARWAARPEWEESPEGFQELALEAFEARFLEALEQDVPAVYQDQDEDLDPVLQRAFAPGIASMACLPVHVDEQLWGFLGLDQRGASRSWERPELDLLSVAGHTLALALERRRTRQMRLDFEEFASQSEDVIWVADPNGELIFINETYEELWGQPRARLEEESHAFMRSIHPEDRDKVHRHMRELSEGPRSCRYRLERQGRARWIRDRAFPLLDEQGQVRGYGGIASDVTEIYEARQALRRVNAELEARVHVRTAELEAARQEIQRSQARYQGLFDQSLDAILVLEPGGEILEANQAAHQLYERPAGGLEGEDIATLHEPSAREALAACLWRALERGRAHFELKARTERRGPFVCETSLKRLDVNGEELLQWISRDLTRRRRAERALQESRRQLLQVQKMDALGRLASGIAHDFNNILAVILSYAEFLEADLPEGDPLRADAAEILAAGQRASKLTNQLLAFSRKQQHELEPVDLNALVEEMGRMIERLIGEDVRLVLELHEQLPPVLADQGQLEQVVLNLAINARDAMPQGGELILRTLMLPPDDVDEHIACALEICDSGEGMEPEVAQRAFEPFFTTKPRGTSTGLGLSTAYGIVRQHGGDITLDTTPGRGTCVKLSLLCALHEAAREAAPEAEHEQLGGEETLLLVEDDDSVRRLATRILTAQGWRVLEAATADEAIELAGEHHDEIELLVTDVMLPGMSGGELASQLIGQHPDLRVLYMSGHMESVLDEHAQLQDWVALLKKPFRPRQLIEAVWRSLHAPGPVDPEERA